MDLRFAHLRRIRRFVIKRDSEKPRKLCFRGFSFLRYFYKKIYPLPLEPLNLTKNQKLIVAISAMVVMVAVILIPKYTEPQAQDDVIVYIAQKLNADCPVNIDERTVLDSVNTSCKTCIDYYYTFTTISEWDAIKVERMRKQYATMIDAHTVRSAEMRELLNSGVALNYHFFANNRTELFQLPVTNDQ
jgi:hypothetical protein